MKTIRQGAIVDESACIEDNVEIGYNSVVLSGAEGASVTRIMQGAVVGSNCTIYEGVRIGQQAKVLSGSVVKQSVPSLAIVEGNPANIVGYVNTKFHVEDVRDYPHEVGGIATSLKGVKLFNFPNIPDLRGNLTVGEVEKQIPFVPRRYFIVYGVPTAETRGEHAHVRCHQFLIALSGSINVIADDGANREEFILNRNNLGLYLPAMTWGIQYRYSRDAVLLVFASEFYDPQDYIRDYETFIAMSRAPAA